MENINDLIIRINTETSILFLGQEYEKNLYINSLKNKLPNSLKVEIFSNDENMTYSVLADKIIDYCENNPDKNEFFRESILKAQSGIQDARFSLLGSIGWSGIVTSLMNEMPGFSDFRIVSNKGDIRNDYFSKKNPYITYLFGKAGEEKTTFPITFDEKMVANAQKDALLSKVLSRLKMSGVLVIDGWNPDTDWLTINDFNELISFPPDRVYIFGIHEEKLNRQLKHLVNKGIVHLYPDDLYTSLRSAGYEACDVSGYSFSEDEDGIEITIDSVFDKTERSVQRLSYQIVNQLDSSINVLDDTILDNPDYIDREEFFLRFLTTENNLPLWGGYASGFYFKRDKDDELFEKVQKQLLNTDPSKSCVVLLEGNNSSGKTATLGNLAYRLKGLKKYPIIYITSKMNEQEQYIELERLIKNHINAKMGARKTVIIWDKNTYAKDDVYEGMRKSLEECNVVIVGSKYIADSENDTKAYELVTLDDHLSEDTEMGNLREMLQTISKIYADNLDIVIEKINSVLSDVEQEINRFKSEKGNWFLLIFYRLFEELHDIQKRSVGYETQQAQNRIVDFLSSYSSEVYSQNAFSKMYEMLGFLRPDNTDRYKTNISNIFNMLAVAGKFEIELPAMIIFRVYDGLIENWEIFIHKIEHSSMIMVELHEDGIMMAHFRRPLEAALFLEQQVNNYEDLLNLEVESLLNIIENTNFNDMDGIDSEALQVVNLIRKFGPNGPEPAKYKKFFYKIAETINKVNNDINDEAVLVASHLVREAYASEDFDDNAEAALLEARKRLRKAINKYGNKSKSQQLVRLKVELSANLLKSISPDGDFSEEEKELYAELESYLESAMAVDITKFSVGVFLDATIRVYNIETNKREKARILSRMLQIVDDVNDRQFSFFGENIHNKILTVLAFAQKYGEIDSEYNRLLAEGSDIGIYRRAMKELSTYIPVNDPSEDDLLKVNAAIEELEKNIEIVKSKSRSLYLYIRLLWIKMTKQPMFTEKQFVALTEEQWALLTKLCTLYIQNTESQAKPLPYFILEINSFRTGNIRQFKEITEVTREFRYNYSAYVTYAILCDTDRKPIKESIRVKRSSNRRSIFSAVFETSTYEGIEAYFKDSNFKDVINIYDGKRITSALIGFNLYGVVVYGESDLYGQIGGKKK